MTEKKVVVPKFSPRRIIKRAPQNPEIKDLISACQVLDSYGFAPRYETGQYGNVSVAVNVEDMRGGCRERDGYHCLITASGKFYRHMTNRDFARVFGLDFDRFEGDWEIEDGVKPSSETFLHVKCYDYFASRGIDVRAIFHGHYEPFFGRAEIPETHVWHDFGTLELADEVLALLRENPSARFINMVNHGFISFGATLQEAVDYTLKKQKEIERLG